MTATTKRRLHAAIRLMIAAAIAAWIMRPGVASPAPENVYDITVACGDQGVPAAVPNDGLDDSESIQACVDEIATDGGGTLYIPAGTFDVEYETHDGCLNRNCSVDITGVNNMTIRGEGPASVIRKSGAGGGASSDWWTFRGGDNENLSIHDFAVDGNADSITSVGEQTHEFNFLITGVGSSTRVRFNRMHFEDSRGDCIRTVGNHTGDIAGEFIITDTFFNDCKRGALGVQRGIRRIVLSGNTMVGGTDQQIDFEPSSNGEVSRFSITGNIIHTGGDRAVALSGSNFDEHGFSTFTGNTVIGKVYLYQNNNIIVSSNVIWDPDHTLASGAPSLELKKSQDGIVISSNVIVRDSDTPAGPLIQVAHHNSGNPETVQITGNRLLQSTASTGITVQSAARTLISDNTITYAGTSGVAAGINFTAISQAAKSVSITGNVVAGPCQVGVQVSPQAYDIETLMVATNTLHGQTKGVLLNSGAGDYTADPMVMANSIDASSVAVAAGQMTYAIGGNAGAHVNLVGYNAPTGTCVPGSTYAATKPADEGFYVCASAGWVIVD